MTSRHILLLSCHVHCSSFYVARFICKYAIKNLLSQRGDHVSPLKYTHLLLKVQCVKYHDRWLQITVTWVLPIQVLNPSYGGNSGRYSSVVSAGCWFTVYLRCQYNKCIHSGGRTSRWVSKAHVCAMTAILKWVVDDISIANENL